MNHVPEGQETRLVQELIRWIELEADAAYATKLAILRADRADDISKLGEWLGQHDRHADELSQLVRAVAPGRDVGREPRFVTRDALVIGALSDDESVLRALFALETARERRYAERRRAPAAEPSPLVEALLERHAAESRDRLAWLRGRLNAHAVARHAAA
jgi:hypothetical protein